MPDVPLSAVAFSPSRQFFLDFLREKKKSLRSVNFCAVHVFVQERKGCLDGMLLNEIAADSIYIL